MSATERRKGKAGELEVVRLLHEHGWPQAKRSSDGRSQNQRGDIADGPFDVHFEVRRRETLNIWACLAKAEREARDGDIPVVAFRRSRSRWYAALPLDALLSLLAGYEE
jgi:Holliday junction resolvase